MKKLLFPMAVILATTLIMGCTEPEDQTQQIENPDNPETPADPDCDIYSLEQLPESSGKDIFKGITLWEGSYPWQFDEKGGLKLGDGSDDCYLAEYSYDADKNILFTIITKNLVQGDDYNTVEVSYEDRISEIESYTIDYMANNTYFKDVVNVKDVYPTITEILGLKEDTDDKTLYSEFFEYWKEQLIEKAKEDFKIVTPYKVITEKVGEISLQRLYPEDYTKGLFIYEDDKEMVFITCRNNTLDRADNQIGFYVNETKDYGHSVGGVLRLHANPVNGTSTILATGDDNGEEVSCTFKCTQTWKDGIFTLNINVTDGKPEEISKSEFTLTNCIFTLRT